jgi:NAD(P)-dependent dehydrogenase (short-subunit alcohol dehydrogenase family)
MTAPHQPTAVHKALITGTSRGIGNAIAQAMTEVGHYDIYGLNRSAAQTAGVTNLVCDLANPEQLGGVTDELLSAVGSFDVLVLNAGVGIFKAIDELSVRDWTEVLNVGLTAPYVLLNRLLPTMKQHNFGRIVLISSDADHLTFAEAGAYCAAKAGLVGLAGCVRKEVADYDIHITVISPGRVDTHFNSKRPGDRPAALLPAHVAKQVLFAITQPTRCEIEYIAVNSPMERLLH